MNLTPVSFREAFLFWLKLGFISFGGPAGQIAILHGELVERRRWIGALLWVVPMAALTALFGWDSTLTRMGWFSPRRPC